MYARLPVAPCTNATPGSASHPTPQNALPSPPAADHFQHEHFLCPHPACMEKKFVVFPTEQELKTHTARWVVVGGFGLKDTASQTPTVIFSYTPLLHTCRKHGELLRELEKTPELHLIQLPFVSTCFCILCLFLAPAGNTARR